MIEPVMYLSRRQAAAYLNISVATLARWASRGTGPAHFKLAGLTRYLRSDLDAFLAERRKQGAMATTWPAETNQSGDCTDLRLGCGNGSCAPAPYLGSKQAQ